MDIPLNSTESEISENPSPQGLKPRISVCLICKNEERFIGACLESLLPVAYEVIVLDTGSTDSTKKIVGSFQESNPQLKLYETAWFDDFSLARNESLTYATGDWILFMGADEILTEETQLNILPFLEQNQGQPPGVIFCFKIINPQPGGLLSTSYFRQAVFKNGKGISFTRPVHEQLTRPENDLVNINYPDFTIYHSGQLKTEAELKTKTEKYKQQIYQAIENNPDPTDNFYYYHHLGNAFALNNQHNEALEAFISSRELFLEYGLKKDDLVYGSLLIKLISELILYHQRYNEAIILADELLEISPGFPDALFYKGLGLQNTGQPEQALNIYEGIIGLFSQNIELNPLGIISQEQSLLPVMLLEMSHIALKQQDKQKGLLYLNYALRISPGAIPVLYHLTRLHLLENNLSQAFEYYMETPLCTLEEKAEFTNLHFKDFLSAENERIYLNTLIKLERVGGWTDNELGEIREKIANVSAKGLPKVSLCLVATDETADFENCIMSFLPVLHEIIFLETTAGNLAKKLCQKLGFQFPVDFSTGTDFQIKLESGINLKIIVAEPDNNISNLKNSAFAYATGDWIITAGSGQILNPASARNFLPFLLDQPYQDIAVAFNLKVMEKQEGLPFPVSSLKDMLFRNGLGIISVRPVAEHLFLKEPGLPLINYQFLIIQSENIVKNSQKKLADNILSEIKTTVDTTDNYYYYLQLGDAFNASGDDKQAMAAYIQAYELFNLSGLPKNNAFYGNLLSKLVRELILKQNDFHKAFLFCEELLLISHTFQDALFFLGLCRQNLGNIREALDIYEYTSDLFFKADVNPLGIASLEDNIVLFLYGEMGKCYLLTGQQELGNKYLEQAEKILNG